MKRHSLYFVAPYQVEVREEPIPELGPDDLLVKTVVSGISAGTELLLYQGLMPQGMATDATIDALAGSLTYPLKYGYSAVGKVVACGADVSPDWQDALVFAFNPHESYFVAQTTEVQRLPFTVAERGVFIPNLETAVSFIHDARPLLGENVVLFGQGVVGLLTLMLLARFPLGQVLAVDGMAERRAWSARLGATATFSPEQAQALQEALGEQGADLCLELSGNPAALNQAIQVTGYAGRVVIGSWYGRKQAALDLGGAFHRNHIQLLSSQVSRVGVGVNGRWDKLRRFQTVHHLLAQLQPEQLITHRYSLTQAEYAYHTMAQAPQGLQTVFTYT